jgi:ferredoxin
MLVNFGLVDNRHVDVFLELGQVGAHQVEKFLFGRSPFFDSLAEPLEYQAGFVLVELNQNIVFVFEIKIDGPVSNAGLLGHLGHGGMVKTLLCENFHSRFKDLVVFFGIAFHKKWGPVSHMADEAIKLGGKKRSVFIDKVKEILPEGGNLNLCLTCGACSSGCPATGLEGMDPRKFLRMAALGMDEEVLSTKWVWMCSMCTRCMYVCPMKINIPQLVFNARAEWPRDQRPKGILGSCDMALRNDTCSAMGATEEDFQFVVEDVLEEYQEAQPEFAEMQAPVNKKGATFFLNQNSREPVTEPDEMVPLWKILNLVGADWTYGTKGWAAENYCMFLGDDDAWKHIVEVKKKAVEDLGCKVWLNTE